MKRARQRYAAVAVDVPLEHPLHYTIPAALQDTMQPGVRVRVPLGPRQVTGVVVELSHPPQASRRKRMRDIQRAIDPQPVFSPALLQLGRWVAERYCCSWGEALHAMMPPVRTTRGVVATAATQPVKDCWYLPQAGEQDVRLARQLSTEHPQTYVVRLASAVHPWEWLSALLARGDLSLRPVLVLVPEVSYVDVLQEQWEPEMGDAAVFVHHQCAASIRQAAWGRIVGGGVQVVVGTRLAVFAPLEQLRLIILMDEQESSYKQDGIPHYHARDVALERARQAGASTVLVSATPSLEAWQMARTTAATLVEVHAVDDMPPAVQLVDVREHSVWRRQGIPLVSLPLERTIERAMRDDTRTVLLLNRVGFAQRVACESCGHIVRCADCTTPMMYSSRGAQMRCRWCGRHEPAPTTCGECAGTQMTYRGAGIEKVHSEFARRFPEHQIMRGQREQLKTPTIRRAWRARVQHDPWQMLIGTDVALHGWPLPKVDLLAVLDTDAALSQPNFRSLEHVFQRLMRARQCVEWSEQRGALVIQTRTPDHPIFQWVRTSNVAACYQHELAARRGAHLPPWTHVIEVVLRGRTAAAAESYATALADALRAARHPRGAAVMGPAPLTPVKRRGEYHWHVVLRGKQAKTLTRWLTGVLERGRRWQGHAITIDVDPI